MQLLLPGGARCRSVAVADDSELGDVEKDDTLLSFTRSRMTLRGEVVVTFDFDDLGGAAVLD